MFSAAERRRSQCDYIAHAVACAGSLTSRMNALVAVRPPQNPLANKRP